LGTGILPFDLFLSGVLRNCQHPEPGKIVAKEGFIAWMNLKLEGKT
jgi:hypothetical protein